MAMISVSIIIPCYDEEESIPHLMRDCEKLAIAQDGLEFIFVDNGSRDGTRKKLCEFAKFLQNSKIVKLDTNQGYGVGVLAGLAEASGNLLAWTHADLQASLEDIPRALEIFYNNISRSKYLLVKGKRRKKNRPGLQYMTTLGMQMVCSLALKMKLSDINAPPKFFSRDFYDRFLKTGAPRDFSLDLYALYCAKKYGLVLDFPVLFPKRPYGQSKGGGGSLKRRLSIIKKTLCYLFKLKKQSFGHSR